MSSYKIVVNGELLPGFELDSVKENIARTFKLNDPAQREKAFARIFSGKPMVFKKGLTQEQAKAYETVMKKSGLACVIESEQAVASGLELSAESGQEKAAPATASQPQSRGEQASETPQQQQNPYAQPTADLETPAAEGDFVLVEPQKVPAGGGLDWIKEGYAYFKKSPLAWIGMTVLFFVITIVMSFIPFVSLLLNILNPVFIGGFMIACYKLAKDETFGVGDMFAGFKNNFGTLAAVGGIYLVAIMITVGGSVGLMMGLMGQEKMAMLAQSQDPAAMFANFSIVFLVVFGLMTLVFMAYIFAPVLVVMHNVTAIEAMKLSFKGCLRNIWPFLVYGVVAMILGFIAVIPFGLGLLILTPVLTASVFAAYRQIYTESAIA
jgi:uncharacterized membrane protein